uniref:Uncharacterized protein n=3 Tax=Meloidogyne TaxID=189290 RepID=A0A6V7WZ81_MELEN|nr:unnamed protein product [Meloidogyne enterolobii]
MPPKPIPAPQKVIKGGKGIKLSDNAFSEESENSDFSDSEVTVEYESENSEHLNVTTNDNKSLSAEKEIVQKEKSTSKSVEKEIIKRSCTNCKNKGFSSDTYNSHISSNKNCPCKSLQSPEIVSSRPDKNKEKTVEEIDQKIEKFFIESEQFKISDKEKELQKIQEKEKEVGIKIVNSILNKRTEEDIKEKMILPKIPKRKLPMSEEIFYNSPVQMIVPKKVEDKAYTVLKSKREKLVKECKTQSTNSDGRGSHSREAGYLLRIRALTSDCLNLIPRDGCRTVEKRAEFWTKLELINEAIQHTIRHANEWDIQHASQFPSCSK